MTTELTLGYIKQVANQRNEDVRFDRKPGIATKVWFE